MNERMNFFIQSLGISVSEFERLCNLSNGAVSKMGDNTRTSTLDKISKVYPTLNIVWLRTGEGEMIKGSVTQTSHGNNSPNINDNQVGTRPRIPMAVAAGLLTGFSDSIKSSDCEQMPIIKAFPPYDCTMIVKGDSMEPKFEGGDEIAIRKVCDVIEWGKTYVLDTRDGAVLKRLYDSGDKFKCVSFNSEYPDFEVNKDDVFGVYKVVGLLRI